MTTRNDAVPIGPMTLEVFVSSAIDMHDKQTTPPRFRSKIAAELSTVLGIGDQNQALNAARMIRAATVKRCGYSQAPSLGRQDSFYFRGHRSTRNLPWRTKT